MKHVSPFLKTPRQINALGGCFVKGVGSLSRIVQRKAQLAERLPVFGWKTEWPVLNLKTMEQPLHFALAGRVIPEFA